MQAQTGEPAAEPVPNTRIEWNRDTLHFGEIEEGTLLLDSFIVKNIGDAPYLIRDIKTTCDCTLVKYPKKPIPPGKSGTIRLEFESVGKSGATYPGLVVYDNSSPNARSILYLNGYIIPRRKIQVIKQ